MVQSVSQVIASVRLAHDGVNFPGEEGARQIIDDLWGAGWTLTRRRRGDPFDVPKEVIPNGMAYEWANKSDLDRRLTEGWAAVPAERHDGLFAPVGSKGDIEVSGTVLVERDAAAVVALHDERVRKAHQNVEDWKQKYGGFSGGVRVWTGDSDEPPAWQPVGDQALARKITESPRAAEPIPEPIPEPIIEPPKVPQLVPRHRWLSWLFNLISKEA